MSCLALVSHAGRAERFFKIIRHIRARIPFGNDVTAIRPPMNRFTAINGLTPGALYAVQVRALGGNDRHSDWSDTVQHRAM